MIKGKGEEAGCSFIWYTNHRQDMKDILGRTYIDRCTPRETHMQEPKKPWLFVPETIENMGWQPWPSISQIETPPIS
jgi:hypothetical protein